MERKQVFGIIVFLATINVCEQTALGLPDDDKAPNKLWDEIWKHMKDDSKILQDIKEGKSMPSLSDKTREDDLQLRMSGSETQTSITTKPTPDEATTLNLKPVLTSGKTSEISFLLASLKNKTIKLSDEEKLALFNVIFSSASRTETDQQKSNPISKQPMVPTTGSLSTGKITLGSEQGTYFDDQFELLLDGVVTKTGQQSVDKTLPRETTESATTGIENDEESSPKDNNKLSPDQEMELFLSQEKPVRNLMTSTASTTQRQNPTESEAGKDLLDEGIIESRNEQWKQKLNEIVTDAPFEESILMSLKTSLGPSKSISEGNKDNIQTDILFSSSPKSTTYLDEYQTRNNEWRAMFTEIVDDNSGSTVKHGMEPMETTIKPSLGRNAQDESESNVQEDIVSFPAASSNNNDDNSLDDDWIAGMEEFLAEDRKKRRQALSTANKETNSNNDGVWIRSSTATRDPITTTLLPSTIPTIGGDHEQATSEVNSKSQNSKEISTKKLSADELFEEFLESAIATPLDNMMQDNTDPLFGDEALPSNDLDPSTDFAAKDLSADERWEEFLRSEMNRDEVNKEEKISPQSLDHVASSDTLDGEKQLSDSPRAEAQRDSDVTRKSTSDDNKSDDWHLILIIAGLGSAFLFVVVCVVVCILCRRNEAFCWKKEKHITVLNTDGMRWDPSSFRPTKENMNAFLYSIPMPLEEVKVTY